ncbi:acyltransferase family protein [Roseibacillus ishigakijimensis]|uniref:Acyltransferase n=1 Tax=Roseibacillus ishigakijimensis TaxID=454146 RepID=A0A934VK96_9BACT|nr:acyltransferase [Roseibacillus ishigakijimensis]MBK1833419.1 acyltransferase [Roseibacillus ishigakijimensis]
MNKPQHILSQTGIRGLAALLVIPSHLGLGTTLPEWEGAVVPFCSAATAVNVFFVLSGFVLCYVYQADEERNEGRLIGCSWKKFYLARFARIYPLYFILTLLAYGVSLLTHTDGAGQSFVKDGAKTVLQLLFLHPFPGLAFNGWIVPSWSLAMEALAYVLIFPGLLALGMQRAKLGKVLIMIFLAPVVYELLAIPLRQTDEPFYRGWGALLRVTVYFPLGMLLYQLLRLRPGWVQIASSHATWATFLVLIWHCFDNLVFPGLSLLSQWGVVFLIFCFLQDSKSLASRFFSSRCMQWLGAVSYSVYLFHVLPGAKLVSGLGEGFFENMAFGWRLGFVVAQIGFILLISHLLFHFVEMRGKRWVLSHFQAKKTPTLKSAPF